jgi:hypothetical protein
VTDADREPDIAPADPGDDLAPDEVRVGSGRAQLLADLDRPGGFLLIVDRIRQSYVDLDDPTYLDFDYLRDLADVLDALPPGPSSVTHIGGGALTFARYVAATRPGSSQLVLEPDAELTALVRERLPLPRRGGIRVRPVGGREGMPAVRDASADVLVLDAFLGGRVPAELTTGEFIAEAARVLRPSGVLLANVADGPPLTYLRRLLAAVRVCLPEVLVIADAGVLRGRRYGNVVLAASRARLPEEAVLRAVAGSAFPRRVLHGESLRMFVGKAKPFTDADQSRSPAPPDAAWRVSDA